ncbi:amidase family protein [Paenibacillus sp. PFR10]|uniref:Amidase family protein n=3 Tax=Paenibacillus TaxID=44249 RepID=A0ABU3RNW6_9BACL|nr:amidase family protein [Paenibacillus sp. PFR10]MDU0205557.1 amidase family protein [Paenibacillus sp. PFR10]
MKSLLSRSSISKVLSTALIAATLPLGALSAAAETSISSVDSPNSSSTVTETVYQTAPNVVVLPPGSESVLLTGPSTTISGALFDVDVALTGVTEKVTAQKFIIEFNPARVDFIDVQAVDSSTTIVGQNAELGKATVVAASISESAVNNKTLIRLKFKAKANSGVQDIKVSAELGLADTGVIQATRFGSLSLQTNQVTGDLNGNGALDIGDLAWLAPYYGITSTHASWSTVAGADFNQNGSIDLTDLGLLGKKVLYDTKQFELMEASVMDIQNAMNAGKLTAVQLVTKYLARIDTYDQKGPEIKAILNVNPKALEEAAALDKERSEKGPRGPLHGIPVIVKDNFNTIGMPTTAGCICLKTNNTSTDAFMIKKLKNAGAIILAKSNLHEFAFGTTTLSSLGGQTKNPYDLTTNPGGSSGGTGAALAANFGTIGLGTDTGGSIRIPSSRNALVGIRPTIGLTSREGIIPLAHSQDVGGPMARSVADAAIALDVVSGYDPNDLVTALSTGNIPKSYTDYLDKDGLKGARIGVIRSLSTGNDAAFNAAVDKMKQLGATVIDVTIPNQSKILGYASLSGTEFKFDLNDYLATLGANAPYKTLTEIIASNDILQSQKSSMIQRDNVTTLETLNYYKDLWERTKLTQQSLTQVLGENSLDAVLYATTSGNANRLSAYSGFPAISFPAGYNNQVPFGIELLGREYDEGTLIKLAYSFEQATHLRTMPASTPALTTEEESKLLLTP